MISLIVLSFSVSLFIESINILSVLFNVSFSSELLRSRGYIVVEHRCRPICSDDPELLGIIQLKTRNLTIAVPFISPLCIEPSAFTCIDAIYVSILAAAACPAPLDLRIRLCTLANSSTAHIIKLDNSNNNLHVRVKHRVHDTGGQDPCPADPEARLCWMQH